MAIKWSTWVTATASIRITEQGTVRDMTLDAFDESVGWSLAAPLAQDQGAQLAGVEVDLCRRKSKLGSIIDQADDSEISPLPQNGSGGGLVTAR